MKRIAYGKLGRSIPLTMDNSSSVGGDIEVIRLMHMLRQDYEVHLVGRNRVDAEIPGVVNHWGPGMAFDNAPALGEDGRDHNSPAYREFIDFLEAGTSKLPDFDAWVLWVGQHGSSLHCVPAIQDGMEGEFTRPLMSLINYGYPLIHMVNKLGVKPIWLCPDPRNVFKMRDLWDTQQRTVLGQYNTQKTIGFYDDRDGKLRSGTVKYVYAGIEMLALPEDDDESFKNHLENPPEHRFGILVNEGPTNNKLARVELIQKWVLGHYDVEIVGHWTEASMRKLGRRIEPVDVTEVRNTLRRWMCTVTFPASNTGWATAKPWECFAAGVLCFKHPSYDDQGHIYGQHMQEDLRRFLSPISAETMWRRINELTYEQWQWLVVEQYNYLKASRARLENGYSRIKQEIG